MQELEAVLLESRQCRTLEEYIASIQGQAAEGARGPCTSVWRAGTIAYRCTLCQTGPASAICVNCFKVGRPGWLPSSAFHSVTSLVPLYLKIVPNGGLAAPGKPSNAASVPGRII